MGITQKTAILLFVSIIYSITINAVSKNDSIDNEWIEMNRIKKTNHLFQNFNEAKFGMFIHWGVYSKLSGEWNNENVSDLSEWIMHQAKISRSAYRSVCQGFYPNNFNAENWVKLAKSAGMKYIIITTKHHDGFSMYNSNTSDFNICSYSKFPIDPIHALKKACDKYGLKFGIYYSHSIDWMDGGDGGYSEYKSEKTTKGVNLWDPSPETNSDYIAKKAIPQIKELLSNYSDISEFWFDYPKYMTKSQSFEFYKLVFDLQPNCLVNSRVGNNYGDFLTTGDNEIPDTISQEQYWETAGTLNNTWGYKKSDNDWKTPKEIIYWLVEIASKGGNYLLNIGPDGSGKIPTQSSNILIEVGKWLKRNGECVYGTNKWIVNKEGSTNIKIRGTRERESEGFTTTFTDRDIWFTQKGNNVYAIFLTDSVNNSVQIKSLEKYSKRINSIHLLGSNKKLNWVKDENGVVIYVPKNIQNQSYGMVFKVEFLNN